MPIGEVKIVAKFLTSFRKGGAVGPSNPGNVWTLWHEKGMMERGGIGL